jgi:hypothetical protein
VGKGGIPYIATHDGRTIRYPDPDIKVYILHFTIPILSCMLGVLIRSDRQMWREQVCQNIIGRHPGEPLSLVGDSRPWFGNCMLPGADTHVAIWHT